MKYILKQEPISSIELIWDIDSEELNMFISEQDAPILDYGYNGEDEYPIHPSDIFRDFETRAIETFKALKKESFIVEIL